MNKNGFTLIEALIVVAIIGILVAIAIPMCRQYYYYKPLELKKGGVVNSVDYNLSITLVFKDKRKELEKKMDMPKMREKMVAISEQANEAICQAIKESEK